MGKGRTVPRYIALYLQARVRQLTAPVSQGGAGREAQDIAKEVGVTKGVISTVKNHAKGVGWTTLEGLARVLEMTIDEVKAEAAEFEKKNPPKTESRIERDPRYESFRVASEFFIAEKGDPRAVEALRGTALKSETDLTPSDWLAEFRVKARELSRSERDPVGTAKKAEGTAADAAARDAEARRSVAEGDTAEPSWKAAMERKKGLGPKGRP